MVSFFHIISLTLHIRLAKSSFETIKEWVLVVALWGNYDRKQRVENSRKKGKITPKFDQLALISANFVSPVRTPLPPMLMACQKLTQ